VAKAQNLSNRERGKRIEKTLRIRGRLGLRRRLTGTGTGTGRRRGMSWRGVWRNTSFDHQRRALRNVRVIAKSGPGTQGTDGCALLMDSGTAGGNYFGYVFRYGSRDAHVTAQGSFHSRPCTPDDSQWKGLDVRARAKES
jgi:hypothetical protein